MDERASSAVRVVFRKVGTGLRGPKYSKTLTKTSGHAPRANSRQAGECPTLTWANFTRAKALENARLLGTARYFTQKKLQANQNLLAAQQQLSRYPSHAPYNMWVSYYNAHVAVHGAADDLIRPVVDSLVITSILRTAPRRIGAHFRETTNALAMNSRAILKDIQQLGNIRLDIACFQDFTLYAEARVRVFRIVEAEKILQALRKAEEDDTPAEVTRLSDMEYHDPNGFVTISYPSSTYSRWESLRNAFDANPESWAIEPLYRGFSVASSQLRRIIDNIVDRDQQIVKITSREKWEEIVAVIVAARNCSDARLNLASELSALQYYAVQHYPQLSRPGRATLGREYFEGLKGAFRWR
jgi:hypothetical protein